MFKFLILLRKSEIRICRHNPVMFGEVLELNRSGSFDDAVRQADVVAVGAWRPAALRRFMQLEAP